VGVVVFKARSCGVHETKKQVQQSMRKRFNRIRLRKSQTHDLHWHAVSTKITEKLAFFNKFNYRKNLNSKNSTSAQLFRLNHLHKKPIIFEKIGHHFLSQRLFGRLQNVSPTRVEAKAARWPHGRLV